VVADEQPSGGATPALVTDTLMDSAEARRRVASETVNFARALSRGRGGR